MRACDWCRRRPAPQGAKYCSHSCRQRAYEFRLQLGHLLAALDRATRHLQTVTAMLRRALAARHLVQPRIEEESPNV